MTAKDGYRQYLKSAQWKAVSSKRRTMDGGCVCCNSTDNLNVHHVAYPQDWYDTQEDNLVTLCKECHTLIHRIQEQYDKFGDIAVLTDDGRINRSQCGWYDNFVHTISRTAAVECWKRDKYSTKDVSGYIRAVNDVLGRDNKRPRYYINVQYAMEYLAFAKDCFLANNNPEFNKGRRKNHVLSNTRFK